ncbi:hypothetical protein BsWGS_23075 [Bradybaena similaris]
MLYKTNSTRFLHYSFHTAHNCTDTDVSQDKTSLHRWKRHLVHHASTGRPLLSPHCMVLLTMFVHSLLQAAVSSESQNAQYILTRFTPVSIPFQLSCYHNTFQFTLSFHT